MTTAPESMDDAVLARYAAARAALTEKFSASTHAVAAQMDIWQRGNWPIERGPIPFSYQRGVEDFQWALCANFIRERFEIDPPNNHPGSIVYLDEHKAYLDKLVRIHKTQTNTLVPEQFQPCTQTIFSEHTACTKAYHAFSATFAWQIDAERVSEQKKRSWVYVTRKALVAVEMTREDMEELSAWKRPNSPHL